MWWGRSVCRRGLSSVPGLRPLDAGGTPSPAVSTASVSRHCPVSPRGRSTRLKTAELCFLPLLQSPSSLFPSLRLSPLPTSFKPAPGPQSPPWDCSGVCMPSPRPRGEGVSPQWPRQDLSHATPLPAQGPEERPVASEMVLLSLGECQPSREQPRPVCQVSPACPCDGSGTSDLRTPTFARHRPGPLGGGGRGLRSRDPEHQKSLGRAFPHPARSIRLAGFTRN